MGCLNPVVVLIGANTKDLLAWTNVSMAILDRTKCPLVVTNPLELEKRNEGTDGCTLLRKQEGTPLWTVEGADWVNLRPFYLGTQ